MAHLTICVPTRNRQRYCIETIRAIATSEVLDIEVLVADNSDDETQLSSFFENEFDDARFRLLPPQDQVLSMVDNWERAMENATGKWVTFIGDDDYIDPRASDLIKRYERIHVDVEAVGWSRMSYNWPDNRPSDTMATVPAGSSTLVANKVQLENFLFRWTEGKNRPSSGFGVYHGAASRKLMERIKARFGNRYFEHPNVDYDSSCKVTAEARKLVTCQRPFSILGACSSSNSAGLHSQKTMHERTKTFMQETKTGVPVEHPDFPFPLSDNALSVCVSVAHTTYWFCKKYNIDLTGFGENFVKAAMEECAFSRDSAEYERKVDAFKRGFSLWENGRWVSHFQPALYDPNRLAFRHVSGVINDVIYFWEQKVKAKTPGEFYKFSERALMPVEHILAGRRSFTT